MLQFAKNAYKNESNNTFILISAFIFNVKMKTSGEFGDSGPSNTVIGRVLKAKQSKRSLDEGAGRRKKPLIHLIKSFLTPYDLNSYFSNVKIIAFVINDADYQPTLHDGAILSTGMLHTHRVRTSKRAVKRLHDSHRY